MEAKSKAKLAKLPSRINGNRCGDMDWEIISGMVCAWYGLIARYFMNRTPLAASAVLPEISPTIGSRTNWSEDGGQS
jgi:hypothetical protein